MVEVASLRQVVKEATNCRVLLFEKETKEAERSVQDSLGTISGFAFPSLGKAGKV